VYLVFHPNVQGSFSASSLVIWAPQVAGGDEPPSVLSDNLPRSGYQARPFLVPARYARLWLEPRTLKGHKLVSQGVAFPRRLPLRWKTARFRFVIKRAGAVRQGEGLTGIRCAC
jgi:hypothetical protein